MKSFLFFCFSIFNFIAELNASFRCDYTYYADDTQGYYLKYQEIPATWHDARLRCHLEGATLASPLNQYIKMSIIEILNQTGCSHEIWTGIHSQFSTGFYGSIEGVPLSEIPHKMQWSADNHFHQQCILQLPNRILTDTECAELHSYFCYKKFDEKDITNECGTIDDEYKLDNRTGKCYKFYRIARTWWDGFRTCNAEGGHLAIINSPTEAQVLKEIFSEHPDDTHFGVEDVFATNLGFIDWNKGDYNTIHGQPLKQAGYDKWASGGPTFYPSDNIEQRCGAMYRSGLLDNNVCDKRATFICEKDPKSLATCGQGHVVQT